MLDKLTELIKSILTAFYQSFWAALLFAVLFMFLWLYAENSGWKKAFINWYKSFETSKLFRRVFLLAFYTGMILFRTLLDRILWAKPLSKIMDGWTLYEGGEFTTEPIENFVLFIPFVFFLLLVLDTGKKVPKNIIWFSLRITFCFSLSIEFLQLILQLGTFQLSDIVYNTLGGLIGGLLYWVMWKVKYRFELRRSGGGQRAG